MKKQFPLLLLAAIISLLCGTASAQEQTLEVMSGGEVVYSRPTSGIDSIVFVNRLPMPQNVQGAFSGQAITISWNAVSGATSYAALRSSDGNTYKQIGTTTTCSYTDNSPLPGNNYYRVQAFGPHNSRSVWSEASLPISSGGTGTPSYNGHEYVDLGLPSGLKWATCNVGASKPEGYGNYYAWGETSTKSTYSESNSSWYGKSYSQLESAGVIDSNGNLTAKYDAATVNWGGSWRMPTMAEMQELLDNCTTTWTTQNGVYGRKLTSKNNGKYIFLPAAGCRGDGSLYYAGSDGYYWSATAYGSGYDVSYELSFDSGGYGVGIFNHGLGRSVRAVSE